MKFHSFLLFAFTVFAPVVVFAEYWVSIASFKNRDGAEAAMIAASRQSAEDFAVHGASTSKGYFFRVAAGPYQTQQQAQEARSLLAVAGLNAGWVWQSSANSGVISSDPTRAEFSVEEEIDTGLYDALPSWESDFESDAGQDDDGSEEGLETRLIDPQYEPLPNTPDTAPPGYQLNKLRRDARAPPLRPTNFLFALSQTRPKIPTASTPQNPPANERSLPQNASEDTTGTIEQATVEFALDSPIQLARRESRPSDMQVDGRLDEAIWRELPGADGFSVIDPDTLAKPPYRTLVKGFYTRRGLYVAIDMEQPKETLIRRLSSRDSRRINRDNVGITLDTSGAGRYGYWMNVALGGSQSDGTLLPERQFSNDWDGAWYSGTAVTQTGWSAEFFLPWSQMAMPKTAGERKINVYISRKVASLDERWSLPALPSTNPLFMSIMQPLLFEDVAPNQQWSVFPYASMTLNALNHEQEENFGADLFWRPSTNFQVTAAISPDFGAVESDNVVVNLSAFETFFPEKRLFFQEGIEVFTATPRAEEDTPTTLLNTRRIGGIGREPDLPEGVALSDLELQRPVALAGALKTVGSFGSFRYGLLGAVEEDATYSVGGQGYEQRGTDYGVARLLYEGKGKSGDYRALGFLSALTGHTEQNTQAHGVDYHYLTATGRWKIDGQFLSSSADQRKDGFGGFADVQRNFGQGRSLKLGYVHYDEHLNINDLGFLQRNDLRGANGRYKVIRSDLQRFRKTELAYWFRLERNAAGDYVRKGIGIDAELDLLNRHQLKLGGGFFPSRDEDLDSRGNGTYRFGDRNRLEFAYRTDLARAFSTDLAIRRQKEKLGGAELTTTFGMHWRPLDNLAVSAKLRYVDRKGWLLWREGVDFATFDSEEWRPELGLEFYPSAKHQIKLSSQWIGIRASQTQNYRLVADGEFLQAVPEEVALSDDFAISDLSLQLRYRWEMAPLSDFFLVYTLNGRFEVTDEPFNELLSSAFDDPVVEQVTMKLRYRFGS
jgi:hypothetical protein